MDPKEKTRENLYRRMATRQGYRLLRNPRRDPRALDYGSYRLTDQRTDAIVADFGWEPPTRGDHLDEVEKFLTRDR